MQRWQGQAQHRRGQSFIGVGAMKEHGHHREEEEDLALFHDMDKLPGDDRHTLLLNTSDEFESRLGKNFPFFSSPIVDHFVSSLCSPLLHCHCSVSITLFFLLFVMHAANAKLSSSPIYKITMPAAATKAGGGGGRGGSDDFLITDGEKNDYDWYAFFARIPWIHASLPIPSMLAPFQFKSQCDDGRHLCC